MIGHGIIFSGSEDIKHPPVGFFDGAKLHKGHFALSLSSFEAAPYDKDPPPIHPGDPLFSVCLINWFGVLPNWI